MRVVSDSRLPVDVDRSALICTFHARRAAALFDPGDHHGADDARSLRSGIAADRGAHRLRHRSARPRSRGAGSLDIEPPEQDVGSAAVPLHLLVDSTGLKLGGAGEWLVEKHGTSRRRSWRKLHIGLDGESGEIVAIELTKKESDDAARTAALLDQLTSPLASFTADGAYDQDRVYETVAERHPNAVVILPPRTTEVPGPSAATAPTQRDRHIQEIVERGRMGLAKGEWLQSAGQGRGSNRSIQTRDRRCPSLAN
jgi:hypothetical protein